MSRAPARSSVPAATENTTAQQTRPAATLRLLSSTSEEGAGALFFLGRYSPFSCYGDRPFLSVERSSSSLLLLLLLLLLLSSGSRSKSKSKSKTIHRSSQSANAFPCDSPLLR